MLPGPGHGPGHGPGSGSGHKPSIHLDYTKNVEIIIARYNESLSWTLLPIFNRFKYTVYNKGDNENFEKRFVTKIIPLPNVGRNDHTFLHHIVTNYDGLARITVFLPGSTNIPYKMDRAKKILRGIIKSRYKTAYFYGFKTRDVKQEFRHFTLNTYRLTDPQNFQKNSEVALKPCVLRPFSKWYSYFFNNFHATQYTYGGVFSADRRDIHNCTLEKYVHILETVSTHSNPEAGHYIERCWGTMFHPLKYTKFVEDSMYSKIVTPIKMGLNL